MQVLKPTTGKRKIRLITAFVWCSAWLMTIMTGYTQENPSSYLSDHAPLVTPEVVVSSYWNTGNPNDEFTELLVISDNLNLGNWTLGDNNTTQSSWNTPFTFLMSNTIWSNLRAGTIIIVWHRTNNSLGQPNKTDFNKADGFIMVAADNTSYFSGGSSNTLNISATGDIIQIKNASDTYVHSLGHRLSFGPSWGPLPLPKLNHKVTLYGTDLCMICPGSSLQEYGDIPPQDGTTWTASLPSPLPPFDTTFGLPNKCSASQTTNSDFWRSLRQPTWNSPNLTGNVNPSNTQVTLNWNAVDDLNPTDGTQGYMILRNSTNTFITPNDGTTYLTGELIGGATVIAIIPSSQIISYIDLTPVPCSDGFYYQIYSYRYSTDDKRGNSYNYARGRAYNETSFGSVQVTYPAAVAPTSASSDRDNFCADDPGNITLSATGGSGNILNWYTGSCGGSLLGPGAGPNNSITIPSPTVTTTYYARWENVCGNSPCVSVTVTVIPNVAASVTIDVSQNPVCNNTQVTFTAIPSNGGASPTYQWYVNSLPVGTGGSTYSYIPLDADQIYVEMISNANCVTGNPAISNTITMTVTPDLPVSVTITADPGTTICAGDPVIFTALPVNGGSNPTYQWYLNGNPVGSNSATYTTNPTDGDDIYCMVTSDLTCATNNPATSNTLTIATTAALPVSASITADPGTTVCAGTTVTYTAVPVNGGASPSFQWYLNGNPVGSNSATYSHIPVDGDAVYCVVTSSSSCATNNPATSNTLTITISSALPVSVTITAAPGNVICSGTTVTFTAAPVNGGSNPTYQWIVNGNPVGTDNPVYAYVPSNADAVSCVLTSDLSCVTNNPATSNSIAITITSALPVSASVIADPDNPVCEGDTVTYTATAINGGTNPTYAWYLNGNPVGTNNPVYSNIPVDGDQVYCVITSDITCATNNPATSNTITISTTQPVLPTVTVTSDHPAICSGVEITFTAIPANEGLTPIYEWFVDGVSVQQGTNPVYVSDLLEPNRTVTCTLTSSLYCLSANPVTSPPYIIQLAPAPVVNLSNDPYLCAGVPVQLDAGPYFTSYLWQDGSTDRYLTARDEGVYWVQVTDTLGCEGSDTVAMIPCSLQIFIPNAFTPNEDGLNDVFRAVGDFEDVTLFSLTIFNRWGEMVFSTNSYDQGWDGKFQGKPCDAGVYAWELTYRLNLEKAITEKGMVTLLR